MSQEKLPWFMRLTIQNSDTGKSAFAMYPCDKYEALESLDSCGMPYRGGNYRHLAESYNGVESDSLQRALAGVIEHSDQPPSVAELNCLGEMVQSMSDGGRRLMEREIGAMESPAITDAINAAYRVLGESMTYDGGMSDCAVSLSDQEPYIRILLFNNDNSDEALTEENTLWADCPVSQADLEAAARALGAASGGDLDIYGAVSVLDDKTEDILNDSLVTIHEVNRFAEALQANNVAGSLAKYKAILRMEICYDLSEATRLAASLDDYEFFQGETLEGAGNRFREQYGHGLGGGEIAEDMGFEESRYGVIRRLDGPELIQGLEFS